MPFKNVKISRCSYFLWQLIPKLWANVRKRSFTIAFVLFYGFSNKLQSLDALRVLEGLQGCKNCCKYNGAIPFKHLQHNTQILNIILWFTGSQCKCFKTGVMWSPLFWRVITLAALFWTFCKRLIVCLGRPDRSVLQ